MTPKTQALARKHEQLLRYGLMAVIIVGIEYSTYLAMLIIIPYLAAVPLSMLVGIVLNWYFSGKFVFKTRRHTPKKEFMLIFTVSLLGVGLQTITAFIAVSVLTLSVAIGKLLAIGVTFFWNYYFRKKFIF